MKRRKLLKGMGHLAMSSSYFYGLQAFIETCMRANLANASAVPSDLCYVNIQTQGAPPRWMFDQPLNPFNKGQDFNGGEYGTQLKKVGSTFHAFHGDKKVNFGGKDLYLPPIWSLNSAQLGTPLADLLNHTLMIRGIDMEINSHQVNRERMVRPVTSQPSIHGLVADRSSRPIAASGVRGTNGTEAFSSRKGLSIVQVPQNDPVPTLVSAFQGPITKASDLPFEMKEVIESLDEDAFKRGLSSVGSEDQQMAAFEMFEKNIDAFRRDWLAMYNKYKQIISADINAAFPGITTVNPIGEKQERFRHDRGANDFVIGSYNAKIVAGTRSDLMAQAFAFAEFALKEKLSSSLSVVTAGVTLQGIKDVGNLTADQHFVGSVTSVFFTSLMYRAFASCLLELTNQLKAESLFDNTVLHVMSEFSRTPKKNGAGSDHGFRGASAMIISGMVKQPGLIGNILKESKSSATRSRYPGTWGEAAPLFQSGRNLVNDDIIQTLCEMLEIPKIAVKGESLVKKSSGSVTWTRDWEVKNV